MNAHHPRGLSESRSEGASSPVASRSRTFVERNPSGRPSASFRRRRFAGFFFRAVFWIERRRKWMPVASTVGQSRSEESRMLLASSDLEARNRTIGRVSRRPSAFLRRTPIRCRCERDERSSRRNTRLPVFDGNRPNSVDGSLGPSPAFIYLFWFRNDASRTYVLGAASLRDGFCV